MLNMLIKVIKRLFLYQIFIVFSYMRYINLQKSAMEFKDRVYSITSNFKLSNQFIDQALKDPVMLFQYYTITSVVLALLAMLGINFFGLLCALVLTINTIIYDIKFPKLEGRSFKLMDLQDMITFDVLLNINLLKMYPTKSIQMSTMQLAKYKFYFLTTSLNHLKNFFSPFSSHFHL